MHTIVETSEFERCAKKLGLTEEECKVITDTIALNPEIGEEIQGTGGARKVRFPAKSKGLGKSSGYRVITFYTGEHLPVFLLSAYAKGQKDDLSQSEKKTIKMDLDVLAETYKKGIKNE